MQMEDLINSAGKLRNYSIKKGINAIPNNYFALPFHVNCDNFYKTE